MLVVDYRALIRRLNPLCTRALEAAAALAISRSHYEVGTEHFMLKLLGDPASDIIHILRALNVSPTGFTRVFNRSMERRKAGNSGRPVFSPNLITWLQDAWLLGSVEQGASRIRSGSLLLALLIQPERYEASEHEELLRTVDRDVVRKRMAELSTGSTEDSPATEASSIASAAVDAPGAAASGDDPLARFTINLTAGAREGRIDPVLGRDQEIRQTIDILCRRAKNNPIIVGEPGVGKTALVEGLAQRIVDNDVPEGLRGVQLLSLDMGLLQAGTGVKGEFEARLTSILSAVKASPTPIILFIDEAHMLIGAGNQAGGSDAGNLLKPALARGELRTIAATTWGEYKKYFEKDAALSRRFQPVKVEEPSKENAIDMMRGLVARLSASHGVYIRDEAVVAAVELSSRYISGRLLPDKAVDLLDTCAARVRIGLSSLPGELDKAQRALGKLLREQQAYRTDRKLAGVEPGKIDQDPAMITLAEQIDQKQRELDSLQQQWQKERAAAEAVLSSRRSATAEPVRTALDTLRKSQGEIPLVPVEVDQAVVASVVADWTGIPVGKMVRDSITAISTLEEQLSVRIKGQDAALQTICRRLRNARAGLQDPRQPLGVLLLVGPSGTGKTETVLSVADLLFGGERFVTTINMSEFQEKHTVSRLIGSPPGYVGYGEGGVLTEAVRQRPYSVVLLDEIEKADPEVMNLFYQVFDKGMLADGEGRVVDFRNTVIFMTSNLGSDITMKVAAAGEQLPVEELSKALRPSLTRHFKAALLARMTIVPYFPISSTVLAEIVNQKLAQVAARMRTSHGVTLTFEPQVAAAIVARCSEVDTGARNVDHIVREQILPVLASWVLERISLRDLPDHVAISLSGTTFAMSTEQPVASA